ncbi:hemagglutinin-like protein [Opitutaceae bacterium TAV1]|nr:hemagglutinin-like protein [Opitutaceae bacterium TAV1]
MKTPLSCLCAALALLATASVTVTRADPVALTGDHVINPGPDDTGSLTVSGELHIESNHADLGTTGDGQVALLLTYQENDATRQVVVYAARSAVEYLWKEGSTDAATASPKMTLGADNTLTLHDATGASTITLTPATGEISAPGGFRLSDGTLIANQSSLRSTALYNAAGQIVAQVGEDGRVIFSNGLAVGQNPAATLTESSTAYLNTVLQNLGFQENPVDPTPVDGIVVGSSNAQGLSVAYDTEGNQYVAGIFSGSSLDIGNTTIAGDTSITTQFIVKRSPSGAILWSKVWHVSGFLSGVTVDASGNVYVIGYFSATAGQSVNLAGVTVTAAGNFDGYLIKLNSTGVAQWAKVLGHPGVDRAERIVSDASGNVYVSGYLNATAGQTINLAGISVTARGSHDGYILKLNHTGTCQWAKILGHTGTDYVSSIALDASGSVYVAGYINATANQTVQLAGISVTAQGGQDGYIVKIDSAGVGQWAKILGHTGSDRAETVVSDTSGNVYVSGYINCTAGQTVNLAGITVTAEGGQDGYILKISNAGIGQWAKVLGHANADSVKSLAVDASDNIYVAGQFSRTASQTVNLAGITVTAGGGQDGYVLKLNSAGAGQWAKVLGHINSDYLYDMALDASGYIYIAGKIPAIEGQLLNMAGTSVIAAYSTNGYILKLDAAGTGQWVKLIPAEISKITSGPGALVLNGYSCQSFILGDTAVAGNESRFLITLPTDQVAIENPRPAASGLTWGNAAATGISAIALGDNAFSTGQHAVSFGQKAVATGDGAVALGGNNSNASGNNSLAAGGYRSTASGSGSVALGGEYSYATGDYSITGGGRNVAASGEGSASLGGDMNHAIGDFSFIGGGRWATVTGRGAVSLGGEGNEVFGDYSLASGFNNYAHGYTSMVFGFQSSTNGDYTTSFGYQVHSQAAYLFAVGRRNVPQGNTSEWIPTDDLFVIGNSSNWEYSNAMTVHKNANIRAGGTFEAKRGIRIPPGGDIPMGAFTEGNDPRTLNAGLRYENE